MSMKFRFCCNMVMQINNIMVKLSNSNIGDEVEILVFVVIFGGIGCDCGLLGNFFYINNNVRYVNIIMVYNGVISLYVISRLVSFGFSICLRLLVDVI